MSVINALSGRMCVCARGTNQQVPNSSLGPCVHYLIPLRTSLTALYFKHTQGARGGKRHYWGCHIVQINKSDRDHNIKGPPLDLFRQGSSGLWIGCLCVNKASCVMASWEPSQHCKLHQRCFVPRVSKAQAKGQNLFASAFTCLASTCCTDGAMQRVNINTCKSTWKANHGVNRLQSDIQRRAIFWNGDETCSLLPNGTKLNANAMKWVCRAPVCCHHLTRWLQKRITSRFCSRIQSKEH